MPQPPTYATYKTNETPPSRFEGVYAMPWSQYLPKSWDLSPLWLLVTLEQIMPWHESNITKDSWPMPQSPTYATYKTKETPPSWFGVIRRCSLCVYIFMQWMGKLYLPDTVQSICGLQCYSSLQSVAPQLSPREILCLKPSLSLSLCCVLTSSMLVIAQVSQESITLRICVCWFGSSLHWNLPSL